MIKTLIYTSGTEHERTKELRAYEAAHKDGESYRKPIIQMVGYFAVLVRGDHEVNQEKLTHVFGGNHHFELADEKIIQNITSAKILENMMHTVMILKYQK